MEIFLARRSTIFHVEGKQSVGWRVRPTPSGGGTILCVGGRFFLGRATLPFTNQPTHYEILLKSRSAFPFSDRQRKLL